MFCQKDMNFPEMLDKRNNTAEPTIKWIFALYRYHHGDCDDSRNIDATPIASIENLFITKSLQKSFKGKA